jgi:hypothetical protein
VTHRCVPRPPQWDHVDASGYGPAVARCVEAEDGTLWVGNDNGFASRVRFCPFCGAEEQIEESENRYR